ncbi:unnamed protein product [Parascedosporium putredinis]|uniref:Uncharacterized protein n=1 Tax=Parascedosporium putredinis TaxID=1442378 RepID=A0A9P1MBD2_9PEZI|nr:unnamed protein product [Parascedosporium putredinis]CAI7994608.1 unnamed protein product [Parascedosporium putredinis]
MKLTCGFEMLLKKANTINNRFVREAAILLEDIDEDGPAFLPTDETIRTWPGVDRDDDDRWMDIDFQELDNELNGLHRNSAETSNKQGFNDPNGAELDSDQSADDPDDDHSTASDDHDEDGRAAEGEEADFDVALDESRFAFLLKEFLDVDQKTEGRQSPQPGHDIPGTQNAEVMGVRQLMESMEAELKKHGALALDTTSQSLATLKDDKRGDGESRRRMSELDFELIRISIAKFRKPRETLPEAISVLSVEGICQQRISKHAATPV